MSALTFGSDEMRVLKRDGEFETVSFDKILRRVKRIGREVGIQLNYTSLAMKVIDQLYDGISTTKIDELTAEQCASLASTHPDYNILAGRIVISNHQKNTDKSFTHVMAQLYNFKDKNGAHSPLISTELFELCSKHGAELDGMIVESRDYLIDYFGFKTLERAYLMRIGKRILETPQHMWLRVSAGIHGDDMDKIKETYDLMSQKYFTHATPTLFNSGTPRPQLSSCFLLAMESDSIEGIYNTLKDCALISKMAGGIGLHIHNVRAKGTHIRGTNGTSNGIVPMLRVFNNTAKYVDQCVPGNTIIYTTDGPMRIDNCIAGQTKVYNANGTAEVIQNVLEHLIDPAETEMVTIGLNDQYKSTFQITDEHPVLVFRDGNYEWVDAGDLDIGDKMVSVIPEYVPVDAPELKEMDCIMCGIVWNYCVCDIFNLELDTKKNVEIYNEILDFIREYFKYYSIEYEEINVKDKHLIRWKGNTVCPLRSNYFFMNHNILPRNGNLRSDVFVYDLFWREPAHSKIIHAKILNLPKEKLELVVKYIHTSYKDPFVQFLKLRLSKPHGFMNGKPVIYNEVEYIEYIDDLTYKPKILLYDLQMKDEHNYLLEVGLVHNGGGKRNGSFAIYLEPWHADIEAFLEMRKNHGDEEQKARDLFYALWVPDLFMERVKSNGQWTLMCPDECPGLADVYGEKFVELYERYEKEGRGKSTMQARDLWFKILDAQMETGTPYICYKDAANKKSNQKNVGTIKSSNLCVAPDTLVLTDKGHLRIDSLRDQTVNVWNGSEWSEVVVRKTGADQMLVRVELVDGAFLDCTPYHKFYVLNQNPIYDLETSCKDCKFSCSADDWRRHTSPIKVDAQELRPGTELFVCESIPDMSHSVRFEYTDTYCLGQAERDIMRPNKRRRYVRSVTCMGRIADTYCFEEPKRHMGVFNGILTGQCTEIMEYSDANETAVCNLASIGLPTFVRTEGAGGRTEGDRTVGAFDYEMLHKVTKVVTKNLNRVIDINYYPTEKTRRSNMRHRPVGLGVQGLADVFMMMGYAFTSDEAKAMNRDIFETIYHAALEASCELAEVQGPYETFAGSPASQGILQFDMWAEDEQNKPTAPFKQRYDWQTLKSRIVEKGLRNSLLVAPMPTASTSQILGFNECIEPITSNIYSRRTNAGEFVVVNKYMMRDLIKLDLWNDRIKNSIIANNGSIQHLEMIPVELRERYRTVWEISMRNLIDMAADRGRFICQSQSLNLWLEDPNYSTLTAMHMYSYTKGLKTGVYYMRRRAKHKAQQFTIEPEKTRHENGVEEDGEHEICEMCSA